MPIMKVTLIGTRAALVGQHKLDRLRHAVSIGIEDWRQGRVDDRPIDEILDEIDSEESRPPTA